MVVHMFLSIDGECESVGVESMCMCVQMCVSPRGAEEDEAGRTCSSRPKSIGFLLGHWGAPEGFGRRGKGPGDVVMSPWGQSGGWAGARMERGACESAAVRGWAIRGTTQVLGWPCLPGRRP